MRSACDQALSMFLSVLLLSLPVFGDTAELIGVARATGPAEINGMAFPSESNVYSGDRISTGQKAALMLFAAPQERIYVAPGSGARFLKDGDATVIALEQGTVAFRTAGDTRLTINDYEVAIRSQGDFPAVAQVNLLTGRGARVQALEGRVEVAGVSQFVFLRPGELALISATSTQTRLALATEDDPSTQAQQSTESRPGSVTGTVVDDTRTVIWRATVILTSETGVTSTMETTQLGEFTFDRLSPGRYTIRITKSGFHPYEASNLLVEAGRQSSLGFITLRRGLGGGRKATIAIVVVAGVAAGVAIPLALRDGDEKEVVSPSVP